MDFNVFTVSFEIESPSVVIVHQILGTILYCSKKNYFRTLHDVTSGKTIVL